MLARPSKDELRAKPAGFQLLLDDAAARQRPRLRNNFLAGAVGVVSRAAGEEGGVGQGGTDLIGTPPLRIR
eukprot:CAMPEP_0115346778 /NCGR_PEP_ID=MMETSP0270-20121206/94531_1 /TAXON_ID=71861 /ORGANISM="Scrippsiella trochoidea, Strain CCMP3099" /LENGTH=70 /DNA_ID=CAMNT_0002768661 /DNA_START=516 /DNA_END=724 /DNA_ORIENTATION=+